MIIISQVFADVVTGRVQTTALVKVMAPQHH